MSETDRSLKDQLNSNQAGRERMCLKILSIQDNFSDVTPRLPKGGPDGGRDLQAFYNGQLCYGAVGFVNDAADAQHRSQIETKFKDDLKSAITANDVEKTDLKTFVFFTNVSLTPASFASLEKIAADDGIETCKIYDRERLANVLDSPKGYAIRFQYLNISMTDAEQFGLFNSMSETISELKNELKAGLANIEKKNNKSEFMPAADYNEDTATHMYFGWSNYEGAWLIMRDSRATNPRISEVTKQADNEYPTIAEAWSNLESLNYALKQK